MLNQIGAIFADTRKFGGETFELVGYSNMFNQQDEQKLKNIKLEAQVNYQKTRTVTNQSGMKAVYGYPVLED